ncbi:MAG: hypothetical protein V7642_6650 [Burkholderiales bacterium]|jgi:hypothetical protein
MTFYMTRTKPTLTPALSLRERVRNDFVGLRRKPIPIPAFPLKGKVRSDFVEL